MEFHGRVGDWIADLRQARERGDTVLFIADSPGRAERAVEILRDYDVVGGAGGARRRRARGGRAGGRGRRVARIPAGRRGAAGLRRARRLRRRAAQQRQARQVSPRRSCPISATSRSATWSSTSTTASASSSASSSWASAASDRPRSSSELRYHDDAKLFVPVERLDLIQSYTGGSRPALDRAGGTTWEKAKTRRQEGDARHGRGAAAALRAAQGRARVLPFLADTHWQEEFEGAFPYELDAGSGHVDCRHQEATWSRPRRWTASLCGDVGYGKTEVAMRAAFKAVMDGKQVAVLAPTTVLAFQHQKTLRERFAGFPGDDRHGQPLPHAAGDQGSARLASPKASSTSWSARTVCCRRT